MYKENNHMKNANIYIATNAEKKAVLQNIQSLESNLWHHLNDQANMATKMRFEKSMAEPQTKVMLKKYWALRKQASALATALEKKGIYIENYQNPSNLKPQPKYNDNSINREKQQSIMMDLQSIRTNIALAIDRREVLAEYDKARKLLK
jgi:HD superfamily phosphohydrolase